MKITKSQLKEIIREEVVLLESSTDYNQAIDSYIKSLNLGIQLNLFNDSDFKNVKSQFLASFRDILKIYIPKLERDDRDKAIRLFNHLFKYVSSSTSFESLSSNLKKMKSKIGGITTESTLNELNIISSLQKFGSMIKTGAKKGIEWFNENKWDILLYIAELLVYIILNVVLALISGGKGSSKMDFPTFKGSGKFGSGGGGSSSTY